MKTNYITKTPNCQEDYRDYIKGILWNFDCSSDVKRRTYSTALDYSSNGIGSPNYFKDKFGDIKLIEKEIEKVKEMDPEAALGYFKERYPGKFYRSKEEFLKDQRFFSNHFGYQIKNTLADIMSRHHCREEELEEQRLGVYLKRWQKQLR